MSASTISACTRPLNAEDRAPVEREGAAVSGGHRTAGFAARSGRRRQRPTRCKPNSQNASNRPRQRSPDRVRPIRRAERLARVATAPRIAASVALEVGRIETGADHGIARPRGLGRDLMRYRCRSPRGPFGGAYSSLIAGAYTIAGHASTRAFVRDRNAEQRIAVRIIRGAVQWIHEPTVDPAARHALPSSARIALSGNAPGGSVDDQRFARSVDGRHEVAVRPFSRTSSARTDDCAEWSDPASRATSTPNSSGSIRPGAPRPS